MRKLLVLAVAAMAVAVAMSGFITMQGVLEEDVSTDDNLSPFCHNITHNTTINSIGAKRLYATYAHIVFIWATKAELAASAVLALAWRCAGIRVTIEPRSMNYHYGLALSAPYKILDNTPKGQVVVGRGVVPVSPRLHVRLAPDARVETRCKDAFYNKTSSFRDRDMLRNCSFLTRFNKTTIYIPKEWKTMAVRDNTLYAEFQTILEFLNKYNMSQKYIFWTQLQKLVLHERNQSFLFVDGDLWAGVNGVWKPRIRLLQYSIITTLRFVDQTLYSAAPSMWDVIHNFTLKTSDIREILTFNMSDPILAASTWALQRPDNSARLLKWIRLSNRPTPLNIDVLLCDDMYKKGYDYMFEDISDQMSNLTLDMNYIGISLDKYYINCSSETAWKDLIKRNKMWPNSYQSIRMVVSGEGVYEIVGNAEYLSKPLSAYSTSGSRHVFPLGGPPEALVKSLQQLLFNCNVRRIAAISEKSDVAHNVTAALHQLHDTGILKSCDVQLSNASEEMITDTLNSLVNDNARIFFINGDTRLTYNIIRVAKSMELTPERGYFWIVREWEGPGDKTMKPYEITFAYRGGDNVASTEFCELERRLNDRWRNGTWPRHAASLANAILTVAIASTRLMTTDPDVINNFYTRNTYRSLLEYSGSLPSMVGDLRIEKQVVKNPRMFVYQWAGEYPTLLAGGAGNAMGGCPLRSVPVDGSIACLTSSHGEAFPPYCNDILWLIFGLVSITFVLIFIITVISCRRASRTREKRLLEEAEEMGKARLDAFTSSLAPYFVEREALKLRYQIGSGRFGLVWFAMLQEPTDGTRPVAAKALREGAVTEEQNEFFREARNLAVLQHDRVIRLVGVCVADSPPLLLMEHAFFGDLLQYLSNRRHLVESSDTDSKEAQYVSAAALTRLTHDAATALAFILRRGFVHRDVRAANCLVDESRTLKLADFGMARKVSEAGNEHDGEYWCLRRTLFPVLWMAPESLSRGVFSSASDMWSLGVLALEVLTLGSRPYGGRSPLTVVELVVAGGRPPLPRDISVAARELLLWCWRRVPADRPTSAAVAAWLEQNPLALQPALADTRTVL